MHIHWYHTVHETRAALYRRCRCGRRKVLQLGTTIPERNWVDREELGLIGHPDGPPIPTPITQLAPGHPVSEDRRVMAESLWHSLQRGDITHADRQRMRRLRESLLR